MRPGNQVVHLDRISWARAQYGAAKDDKDVSEWVAELIEKAIPEDFKARHRVAKAAKQ